MSGSLVVRCPAKVNLWLRVLDRRADGYHTLDTLFQAIELWDRIEAETADNDAPPLTLTTDHPELPVDGSNLVARAVEALRRRFPDAARPVRMRLLKRIPLQGGLGGGSSNAAGALRLLTRLWNLSVEEPVLHEVARELGADVPFFLVGGAARGRGRGDRIEAVAAAPRRWLVLGLPPFGVPTAEAFDALSGLLTLPEIGDSFPDLRGGKWPLVKDLSALVNDLEQPVFSRWPDLGVFCDELRRHGAQHAMLSGSGSTVFGLFDEGPAAKRAADALREWGAKDERFRGWSVVPTTTTSQGVVFESGGRV
ncbi:MAG: 4-(cytidine 5'-diphospho)-2-C-methyl-D-erythritol kinase [Acidobacteriota bacterium]|nr:4-(cytidine 5'-diphospho)-2-C-methyl-D-erythritol kinase [Acidobacteriota bacterium]MDH3785659.1 4-(cytidine 5'-diphospho)-2-C-methyl-D-erythritol kinase [Acidobacteriota bacterium]